MKSFLLFCFIGFICAPSFAQTKAKSGYDMVNYVITQLDKQIVIDKSKSKQIAALYKTTLDSTYVSTKQVFTDYYVVGGFNFLRDSLVTISFDSFYDSINDHEPIKKAGDEIFLFLNKTYGKPTESYGQTVSWTVKHYIIDFTIYDNGWGFYVNSINRELPKYESTADCEGAVGDFFGLVEDLTNLLLSNLVNGKIRLGSTTAAQMAAIFGDSKSYTKEFDGIRLSAYFVYEEGILSSIRYDYFYDCESAKSLLSEDKLDVKNKVETILSTQAKSSGSGDFIGYDWNLNTYRISQSNFTDGYALSINK